MMSIWAAKHGGGAPRPGLFARRLFCYVGPSAPPGKESRWIKTIPGRGWFAYLRIYGPEQAPFDGSWKPGDIQHSD